MGILGRSKMGEGNKWIKERNSFEEEFLALADDASVLYESSVELHKAMQNFTKSVGEDEKKHPYGKASKAVKTYGANMKTSNGSFTKASEQLDGLLAACHGLRDHINSTIMSKVISFKDIDCKECDQLMSLLKKTNADFAKKKKANADQVQIDALEASLKKVTEDAKNMLAKFNKNGFELMNQLASDMKNGFDAYCDAGGSA